MLIRHFITLIKHSFRSPAVKWRFGCQHPEPVVEMLFVMMTFPNRTVPISHYNVLTEFPILLLLNLKPHADQSSMPIQSGTLAWQQVKPFSRTLHHNTCPRPRSNGSGYTPVTTMNGKFPAHSGLVSRGDHGQRKLAINLD